MNIALTPNPSPKKAWEKGERSSRSFSRVACLCAGLLCVSLMARAQEADDLSADSGRRAVLKNKAPVASELLALKLPRPTEAVLPNGLRIFVLENHKLPTVRMALTMKAGTLLEPKPGLAQLTASLLTEGTTTRSYAQITEPLEDWGASFSANAGLETTTITVGGTSDHADALAELMTDALLHPSFPSDRLDNALNGRGGGFGGGGGGRRGGGGGPGGPGGGGSNPTALAARQMERLFYTGTPFARQPATPAQRRGLKVEDLKSFYEGFYHPNGAVLGITGDVKAKDVIAYFTRALGEWKPGEKEPTLPTGDVTAKDTTHIYLIDRPASTQTYLLFANVGVSRTDPDYIPLVVANHILGGGASARLFQNLREDKGYTYGAYSSLTAPRWPGMWQATASVRTPVTEGAVKEFFHEFKRIQDKPVTSDELARAKRALIGSFARTLESPEGVLGRTLELVQYSLPRDYWDNYPNLIAAVTPADVQRVAKKYLGDNKIQLVAVGERAQIEAGLKKFGPVTVTTATTGTGASGRAGRTPAP